MKRRTLPALLLPLALLLSACGGASSANPGGNTDGRGSLTLNIGDQKGGYEAILRASGELDDLDYRIKWSPSPPGPLSWRP